eukprot:CAMPEP_0119047724 /NCGR_PEP_ID=MMETSP1177-20130426/54625_1 /TAXON_ID=2985 /ORGANISM="Ochromonas sp, Strain CCMP1899" /LENGTH=147 /DNA_ID=CAMNT_0007022635 /DNA_START=176 /DNA_END=619 /DNA_ORIENTATION=+
MVDQSRGTIHLHSSNNLNSSNISSNNNHQDSNNNNQDNNNNNNQDSNKLQIGILLEFKASRINKASKINNLIMWITDKENNNHNNKTCEAHHSHSNSKEGGRDKVKARGRDKDKTKGFLRRSINSSHNNLVEGMSIKVSKIINNNKQ